MSPDPIRETTNPNIGHGHVFPRPDGVKARCGGPGLCAECRADAARKSATGKAETTRRREFICSSSHPWRPGMQTPVVHPEAAEVSSRDGHPGGDLATFRCPASGHTWEMELAQ